MNKFYLAILFASGCVVTDVGNPIDAEVEFEGHDTDAPTTMPEALVLQNGVDVQEAYIKVNELRLDRAERCDDPGDALGEALWVDLLAATASSQALFRDEEGDFCRLRLNFTTEAVDGQPGALDDVSIWVTGELEDGTPFSFASDTTNELALTGDFTLPEGSHLLQVGFFLNEWFDVDALRMTPDIDPMASEHDTIVDRISTSARLFHDSNSDGVLDTEEIARSLATSE